MEAQKIKLLSLLGEAKKTFNIPVYQRNYDWKKEHCKRLFQDIEKIALSNFETEHFLGVIVCVASQSYMNYNEWILIDGQQRITSVTLFLIALGKIIGGTIEEDIIESYIINKRASEKLRIKLKPIESDSVTYLSILENDEDVIDKESNIYLNYMYFKELIKHSRVKPQRLYEALTKIELVCISLEKDKKSENPQVIFESLNSTGLSLTQADLIRNFLLMNHCYDEQTDLYKKYWLKMEMLITNKKISDFIRDFLTMKTSKISNKEKVYEEFKAYVIENNFDEKVILRELLTFATYYSYFIHYNHSKTEINQLLEEISLLKSTTVYPFLLYIFNERDKETLEDLEVIKSLKILITYIYRRQVCDYRTNALNKIFANLSNDLKSNNSGEKFVERLLQVLAAKTSSGTFPRDEEFKERFIYKNMYNTSIDKYTLVKIENYNSKENVEISN